jgi:fluoride ion exporter CrcB/FEX
MTRIVLIIGIGGFIGTVARYLSQQLSTDFTLQHSQSEP